MTKAAPRALLSGIHVLVVDDNPDSRDILVTMLTYAGALVVASASARGALRAMSSVVPDVVITDIAMPRTDGYALMRQLREVTAASARRVPVVAVTGHAPDHRREAALSAGFDEYVTKPVDPWELCRLVERLVKGRPRPR